jgi:hypothetical protein
MYGPTGTLSSGKGRPPERTSRSRRSSLRERVSVDAGRSADASAASRGAPGWRGDLARAAMTSRTVSTLDLRPRSKARSSSRAASSGVTSSIARAAVVTGMSSRTVTSAGSSSLTRCTRMPARRRPASRPATVTSTSASPPAAPPAPRSRSLRVAGISCHRTAADRWLSTAPSPTAITAASSVAPGGSARWPTAYTPRCLITSRPRSTALSMTARVSPIASSSDRSVRPLRRVARPLTSRSGHLTGRRTSHRVPSAAGEGCLPSCGRSSSHGSRIARRGGLFAVVWTVNAPRRARGLNVGTFAG